ncbi:hypothetical protein HMI55_001697 [Coelomomyces lativittatus]|nr:hypothetical protein HMI55_001697 [Coelomomyces lativittatus]
MNDHSSRSHALLTFILECYKEDQCCDGSLGEPIKSARINLVDLAGAERVGHTGAEGLRLKEGGKINQSLLTLSNVIQKLASRQNIREHIPYRDSKLTRILEPSLGGNSRTLIICTVTPSTGYIEETLSSLKFANRAKNIRNEPRLNEKLDVSFQHFEDMIISLKTKLFQARENPPILARYKKLMECIFTASTNKRSLEYDSTSFPNKKPKLDDEGFEWALKEVESLAKKKEDMESQLIAITSEREQLEEEKRVCLLDLERHKSILESLRSKDTELVAKFETQSMAFDTLKQELQEVKEKKEHLNSENILIQTQYKTIEESHYQAIEEHQSMIHTYQEQINTLKFELDEQQKAKERIHGLFLAAETQLKNVTVALLTELKAIERKCENLGAEKETLNQKLIHALNNPTKDPESLFTISQLQIQVKELKFALGNALLEKETLLNEFHNVNLQLEQAVSHVKQLQNEARDLKLMHEELNKAHQDLSIHKDSLQIIINAKEEEYGELKKSYHESQSKQIEFRTLLEESKRISAQAATEQSRVMEELHILREQERKTAIQLEESLLRVKLLESSSLQLHTASEQVKDHHSELLTQKKTLEASHVALVSQFDENQLKLNELKAQLDEKERLSTETQNLYSSLLKEKVELEKKETAIQFELQQQLEKNEALEKKFTDSQTEKDELETRLENFQRISDQATSKLVDVELELEKCKNQIEQDQAELESLKQSVEDYRIEQLNWLTEKENIQSQLTFMKKEIQSSEEKFADFNASKIDLNQRLEEARVHAQTLKDEALEYRIKLDQQEQVLQQLRQENQILLSELEITRDNLQKKSDELNDFERSLLEKQKELKALGQKIETLEFLKERHTQQLKKQELQLLKYQENEAPDFENFKEMEEKCNQQAEIIEKLTKELNDTQVSFQKKTDELNSLIKSIEFERQQIIDNYESRMQELRIEVSDFKISSQQLKHVLVENENERNILHEEKATIIESLAQAQLQIQELKEFKEKYHLMESKETEKLKEMVEAQTHEIVDKTFLLDTVQIELASRVSELEALQKENELLKEKIKESNTSIAELKKAHDANRVQQEKNHQVDLEKIASYEARLNTREEEFEKLSTSLNSITQTKKDLQSELLNVEESLRHAEASLKEKNAQIFKLESEYEKNKKDYQTAMDELQLRLQNQTQVFQSEKATYIEMEKRLETLETEFPLQLEKVQAKEQLIKLLEEQVAFAKAESQRKAPSENLVQDLNSLLNDTKKALEKQTVLYAQLQEECRLLQSELAILKPLESDQVMLNQKYSHLENDHKRLLNAYQQLELKYVELDTLHSKHATEFEMKSKEVKARNHELKKKLKAYELQSHHTQENIPPPTHINSEKISLHPEKRVSHTNLSRTESTLHPNEHQNPQKLRTQIFNIHPPTVPSIPKTTSTATISNKCESTPVFKKVPPKPRPECSQQ